MKENRIIISDISPMDILKNGEEIMNRYEKRMDKKLKRKSTRIISKGSFFKRDIYGVRWYGWLFLIFVIVFLFFMR